jgi:hypothetical protein
MLAAAGGGFDQADQHVEPVARQALELLVASDSSIMRRCCTTSCAPQAIQACAGRPSRPARPVSW